MKLKGSYLISVFKTKNRSKSQKNKVKELDKNITKTKLKNIRTLKKSLVHKTYIEGIEFLQKKEQKREITKAIISNVIPGVDLTLQFHLAVNKSQSSIWRILLQMLDIQSSTKISTRIYTNEQIPIFSFFSTI